VDGVENRTRWFRLRYNRGCSMTPSSGFRVGRILGIPVYLHSSWFLVFALITYSLATQFTQQHPTWSPAQHWALGLITSILFFASVVFHELGHSVIALHYKIPVLSITLFIFGGLARIGREPASAKQEFNIAIAGPIASFFLAGTFFMLARWGTGFDMLAATSQWLAVINFSLGVFNLVPGFPLDGGRILRATAWAITRDFARATRFAARSGQFFAYVMIMIGIWQAFHSNLVGGLWLVFIGWFLLSAAQESYAQVAIRATLQGLRAADVMSADVPVVSRDISLEDYVHEVLRTGRRCHVVTGSGVPVGLITLHSVQKFPREEWANTSVQAAMLPRDRIHWATPDEPVLGVLERMQSEDINQMPVIDGDHIVGMITRDSILRVIQTRLQVHHLAEQ
jgi:Zn-dependent protease/predicted transcriptional regulator